MGAYQRALSILREIGDRPNEAVTLSNLGGLYRDTGQREAAMDSYSRALTLMRQIGDHASEAVTLFNLAMVHQEFGDLAKAEELMTAVVALDEEMGHPDLESDRSALERIKGQRLSQVSPK